MVGTSASRAAGQGSILFSTRRKFFLVSVQISIKYKYFMQWISRRSKPIIYYILEYVLGTPAYINFI